MLTWLTLCCVPLKIPSWFKNFVLFMKLKFTTIKGTLEAWWDVPLF